MGSVTRRLSQITRAFVDRTAIDWSGVLARMRDSPDRGLAENLHLLDRIRRSRSTGWQPREVSIISWFAICLVASLAAAQTAGALLILGAATLSGETIGRRISQVALGTAFAAASLFLVTVSSRDSRRIWLAATFATVASAFMRASLGDLPPSWSTLGDPLMRGLHPEVFAPVCLWQFSRDFPRGRRFASFDVSVERVIAGVWLIELLIFAVNVTAERAGVELGPLAYLRRNHPSHIFWHVFTLAFVPPVGAILLRSRRAPTRERRQVARLAAVIAASTAPFLMVGSIRSVLPGFDEWFGIESARHRVWLDGLVIGSLIAMPVLATAAIIVDRPFGVWVTRYRFSRDALVEHGTTAIALVPFAAIALTLYRLRHDTIGAFVESATPLLLLCIVAGWWLAGGRGRLLRVLTRDVHRAEDRHQHLASTLEHMRIARGEKEIMAVLEREVRNGIGAHHVHVLRPQPGGHFAVATRGTARFSSDSVLVGILGDTTEAVDLSAGGPLQALLPKRERDHLTRSALEIAAAVKRRDGTISAIVGCGRRRGGIAFDERDRWFLAALTTAAAAANEALAASAVPATVGSRSTSDIDVAFECPACGRVTARDRPTRCCGTALALAALPHHLAGKFLVRHRIGAGGMGIVYLARDRALGRDVALKTLPALHPRAVARLRDEARAMARLNHESLATIYGLEVWRDTPVLVVEYLEGGTLADRLTRGPLPLADATALGIGLTHALAYMHGRNVLHRDLKPSNIGFNAVGAVKLLDFGLATLMAGARDSRSETMAGAREGWCEGTLAYLPPEAYRGINPGPAFDLWALSVVIFEVIAGVNPFMAGDRRATIRRVLEGDFTAMRSRMPPPIGRFFERALAVEAGRRFRDSLELRAALAAAYEATTGESGGDPVDQAAP
jgi:hypothetical protein